ncbi:hypothetical protein SLNWT_0460 [Streptomyces albus]|uniref:N-acetyltransferase domain-containing protein n=1 Tax=Streptomyces albus (strain ATCC 21838 / DSM 41398 / FERM P-419 / JCM 4703 / NBRC 107858) TaxID=1081613 RepID=A0A0B5EPY9_STRA4|nr:hypothetical protein SLNWT_0460 [Streptomyces albus]AOU75148.1 hypothetical protein SLNHY_0457 [Streptomyces albus]AYN30953.1 GNAT family N-acetyltransferase [Streptomyces albus]AYN37654.1 GNAT family N-acetyltransferase [Streptomyces albus]
MDALVRPMTDADCEAVGRLRTDGWRAAYAGLMPRAYLDALDPAEDAALRRGILAAAPPSVVDAVAEQAGEVRGWTCWGPLREDAGPGASEGSGDAELYALYVRPERIGTGLGHLLLRDCLERCAAAGYPRLRLWVVAGNTRARRFYERAGFRPDGFEQTDPVGGEPVTEVRYGLRLR